MYTNLVQIRSFVCITCLFSLSVFLSALPIISISLRRMAYDTFHLWIESLELLVIINRRNTRDEFTRLEEYLRKLDGVSFLDESDVKIRNYCIIKFIGL